MSEKIDKMLKELDEQCKEVQKIIDAQEKTTWVVICGGRNYGRTYIAEVLNEKRNTERLA